MRSDPSTAVRLYLRPATEGWHSIERVVRTVAAHLPSDIDAQVITLDAPARGVFGRLRAMRQVASRQPGVHHVTGDVHYLVLVLPWRRTVLTIHDLDRLRQLRGIRRSIYRLVWFSLPMRLASAVTVISQQTFREVASEFPSAAAKLRVIPDPLPDGLGPVETPRDPGGMPTILHIGTMENKNLGLSIEVAKRLGARLSILGLLRADQRADLQATGVAFVARHDVPDEALSAVYSEADLLLFPSFSEGFGLPIIEAQACGIPVVTSDREPMRTVAGGAAVLVDPHDVDAACSAVHRLLQDPELQQSLRERGFRNSSRFRPDSVAEEYAGLYRALA